MYQVRPRFQIESPDPTDHLIDRLRVGLKKEDAPCKGSVRSSYATLYLPAEEQHYWSPQLSLSFETTEEGSTLLRGLFGPHPSVWTLFIFSYGIIGFAAMVVLVIGLSHWTLDQPSQILWLVPALLLLFLSLYLVAFFGQKKGHDQMVTLQQFLEDCTGLVVQ